jgi:hypothetical protein
MTVGEIKIAAIKLMADNLDENIKASSLPDLEQNPAYAARLVNMPEAINRALDRLALSGKLPKGSAELDDYIIMSGSLYTRYDLSAIDGFYSIDRVVYESGDTYNGNCLYKKEGTELLLDNVAEGSYRLIYNVMPKIVTEDTDDGDEIRVPGNIARLIPYFIKAELYEEDEPELADKARRIFESGLAEIDAADRQAAVQTAVKAVYKL